MFEKHRWCKGEAHKDSPTVLMLRYLLYGSCSRLRRVTLRFGEGLVYFRGRENQTPTNSPVINPEISRALCYKQLKCEITKETNKTEIKAVFLPSRFSPFSTSPYGNQSRSEQFQPNLFSIRICQFMKIKIFCGDG